MGAAGQFCQGGIVHMDNQNRNRAWRRKQRSRLIVKRLRIIKENWSTQLEWHIVKQGMYSKHNLSCNCGLCKSDKHYSIPTLKERKEDQRYKSFF